MTMEDSLLAMKVDTIREYRKWCREIPALKFDPNWEIRIIPPFGGAIVRFTADYNGKHVSVYFDAYSELGYMYDSNDEPIPYWEVFDGNDCSRYLLGKEDEMMEHIKNTLNID